MRSTSFLHSRDASTPAFPSNRIDIWKVYLDKPVAGCEAGVLSPDEIVRAERFHFEKDRIRFMRCRSAVRNLVAAYLEIPAIEIRFDHLANGKPRLVGEQNPRAVQFNVSHSGNMALIAIGREHRLGVDIEKIRFDLDTTTLAERFFSHRERTALRALPDHLRAPGFYACWTRKESFLKATGKGLSFPLADFSVTTHPDRDPEVEDINGNKDAGKQWFLADLDVAEGYRSAVALECSHCRMEIYAWN